MSGDITYAEYRDAACAVYDAVEAHQGKKRPHIDNFKSVAAKALGITRLYKARWEAVLSIGGREGLFSVDRLSLSYPFIVLANRNGALVVCREVFEKSWTPPGAPVDEDTSDPDTANDILEEVEDQYSPHARRVFEKAAQEAEDESAARYWREAAEAEDPSAKRFALLVKFPPATADGCRGLHVYLDTWLSAAEVDQAKALAKGRGAVSIQLVTKA